MFAFVPVHTPARVRLLCPLAGAPEDVTRVALWRHFSPFGVQAVAMTSPSSGRVTLRDPSVDVVLLCVRATAGKPFLTGTLQVRGVRKPRPQGSGRK